MDPWPTCPPDRSGPTAPGPCSPRSPTTCSAPPAPWPETRWESPVVPRCAGTWSTCPPGSPARRAGPRSTCPPTGPARPRGTSCGTTSSPARPPFKSRPDHQPPATPGPTGPRSVEKLDPRPADPVRPHPSTQPETPPSPHEDQQVNQSADPGLVSVTRSRPLPNRLEMTVSGHGCPGPAGCRIVASEVDWPADNGTLRPTITNWPPAMYRPTTMLSGRLIGPMTAPINASSVVRCLNFCQP